MILTKYSTGSVQSDKKQTVQDIARSATGRLSLADFRKLIAIIFGT